MALKTINLQPGSTDASRTLKTYNLAVSGTTNPVEPSFLASPTVITGLKTVRFTSSPIPGLPSAFVNLQLPLIADFNFVNNTAASYGITNARTGAYFDIDSTGTYTNIAANGLAEQRFDPFGKALGLGVWGSYTNSIRNNSMQGAVAGTPGTLPTNWSTALGGVNAGTIAANVLSIDKPNGIDTITLRITGNATGAGRFPVCFEAAAQIAALTAQPAHVQAFVKQIGSATNVSSMVLGINENTGAGALVQTDLDPTAINTLGVPIAAARISAFFTTGGGGTVADIQPGLFINFPGAGTVDITVQIGWPMASQSIEQRFHVPIRTTAAAVFVQGDTISVPTTGFPFPTSISNLIVQCWYLMPMASLSASQGAVVMCVDDGTVNNRYQVSVSTSSGPRGGIGNAIVQGGVSKALLDGGIIAPLNQFHCVVSSFDLAGSAVTADGGIYPNNQTLPATAANGVGRSPSVSTPMTTMSTIHFGRIPGGNDPLYGYLQRIKIYNAPATDSTLLLLSQQQLAAP